MLLKRKQRIYRIWCCWVQDLISERNSLASCHLVMVSRGAALSEADGGSVVFSSFFHWTNISLEPPVCRRLSRMGRTAADQSDGVPVQRQGRWGGYLKCCMESHQCCSVTVTLRAAKGTVALCEVRCFRKNDGNPSWGCGVRFLTSEGCGERRECVWFAQG